MIKLNSLDVDGFKNLRIQNLEFPPEGNILVTGRNESGKSSLFEAIFFALTSKLLVKKARGFIDAIAFDKEMAVIDLTFQKDGIPARIRKKIFKTSTGTSVEIEFWKKFVTRNEKSIRGMRNELDPIIEEFLGFDDQILLNSSFVKQKGLDGFMDESKQDRIKILNKLLNLEKISDIRDQCKKDLKDKHVVEDYFEYSMNIKEKSLEVEKLNTIIEKSSNFFNSYEEYSNNLKTIKDLISDFDRLSKESTDLNVAIKIKKIELEKLRKDSKDFKNYQELIKKFEQIENDIKLGKKEKENLQKDLLAKSKELDLQSNRIAKFNKNKTSYEKSEKLLSEIILNIKKFENLKIIINKIDNIKNQFNPLDVQIKGLERNIITNEKQCDKIEKELREHLDTLFNKYYENIKNCAELESNLQSLQEESNKLESRLVESSKIEDEINKMARIISEKEKDEIIIRRQIEDYEKSQEKLIGADKSLIDKSSQLKNLKEKFNLLKKEELKSRKYHDLEALQDTKEINKQELIKITAQLEEDKDKLKSLIRRKEKLEIKGAKSSLLIKLSPLYSLLIILGIVLSFIISPVLLILTAAGIIIAVYLFMQGRGKSVNKKFDSVSEQYINEIKTRIVKFQEDKGKIESQLEKISEKEKELKDELSDYASKISLEELSHEIDETQKKLIQLEEQVKNINLIKQEVLDSLKDINLGGIKRIYQQVEAELAELKSKINLAQTKIQSPIKKHTEDKSSPSKEANRLKKEITETKMTIQNVRKECEKTCNSLGISVNLKDGDSAYLEKVYNEELRQVIDIFDRTKDWRKWDQFYSTYREIPCLEKSITAIEDKYKTYKKDQESIKAIEDQSKALKVEQEELYKELPEKYHNNDQGFERDFKKHTIEKAKLDKSINDLEDFFQENNLDKINEEKQKIETQIEENKNKLTKVEKDLLDFEAKLKQIKESIPEEYQKSQNELNEELNNKIEEINQEITSLKTSGITNWKKYNKDAIKFIQRFTTEEPEINSENIKISLENLQNKFNSYLKDLTLKLKELNPNFSDKASDFNMKDILSEQQNKIGGLKTEIERFNEDLRKLRSSKKTVKIVRSLELDENNYIDQYNEAFRNRLVTEKAIEILEEGQSNILKKVLPKTEENLTRILPILTGDRYKDAYITNDYQIKVFDSKLGDYVEKTLFSGGTNDQIALAIRLSFAMVTMPDNDLNESFIFLDEPLGFFDDERKTAFIDFLTHGSIAEKFAQRIVISNFGDIKKHFDFVIELENGKIIEQYSTGSLESTQIESVFDTPAEHNYVSIEQVKFTDEDDYYEEILQVKNVSEIFFDGIQINVPEFNVATTPKYLYGLKPGLVKNFTIGYNRAILEKESIYFDVIVNFQKNGTKVYRNQKINYVPQLK